MFAMGLTMNFLMYTVMMMTESIDMMLVSIFMQGALTSIRVNNGYLYLLEMMPKHLQTTVGSVQGVCDSSIYLFATLYFWKVSKEWYLFASIGYVANFLVAIAAWLLPESPRYLLDKGRIDELEATMTTIAKVNQKPIRFHRQSFLQPSEKDEALIDEESKQAETQPEPQSQEQEVSTSYYLS